jgi:hypothetical protein
MRVLTMLSVVGPLLLLGPSMLQAKTCKASGHPACSITCPDNQGCAAVYKEPNGPCKTGCFPPKGMSPIPGGGSAASINLNSSKSNIYRLNPSDPNAAKTCVRVGGTVSTDASGQRVCTTPAPAAMTTTAMPPAGPAHGAQVQASPRTEVGWTLWIRKDPKGTWEREDTYSTEAVAHQHAKTLHDQGNQVEVRRSDKGPPNP